MRVINAGNSVWVRVCVTNDVVQTHSDMIECIRCLNTAVGIVGSETLDSLKPQKLNENVTVGLAVPLVNTR